MNLTFWQFRKVGHEQWLVQPNFFRYFFVRLFGPLGVNARIRSGRMINAFNRLRLPQGGRVLDVGCGHGYTLFWLARQYPNFQFDGLEFDPDLVADGREIARKLHLPNLRFLERSASEISGEDRYDVVLSADVLEHIEDDLGVLMGIERILKPNGILLLHLPRRYSEARQILPIFKNYATPDHVRDEYTADEIREKLSLTGFQVEYLRYGYSLWGELAFESNYLFWKYPPLRVFFAILFHPLSVWLAYMDIRQDHEDGNSMIVLAKPVKKEIRVEPPG